MYIKKKKKVVREGEHMTWQRQMCEDGSNENGNFYMLIWHGILWRDLKENTIVKQEDQL